MLIQRKEYLDKLIAFRDKQLIKVLTKTGIDTASENYRPLSKVYFDTG